MSMGQLEFMALMTEVTKMRLSKTDTFRLPKKSSDGMFVTPWFTGPDDSDIDQNQLTAFMDAVLHSNFSHLDFSSARSLSTEQMSYVLDRIRSYYSENNLRLISLNVSRCHLEGLAGRLIALLSDPAGDLQSLNILDSTMHADDIILLANAIGDHHTLTEVHMHAKGKESLGEYTFYKDDGKNSAAIASMIKGNSKLQTVTLDTEEMDKKGLSAVISALKSSAGIQNLRLKFHGWDHGWADTALAKILKASTTLKHFSLYDNNDLHNCEDMVVAAFGSAHLTEITLDRFSFGQYKEKFLDTIQPAANTQVSAISLAGCGVNNQILSLLKSFPLKKLDLSGNRMYSDTHGSALLDLIRAQADTLEELNLSGNYLGNNSDKKTLGEFSEFLTDLSAIINTCQKLRILKLNSDRNYRTNDVVKFLRRIRSNTNLLHVEKEIHYTIGDSWSSANEFGNNTRKHMHFTLAEMQLKNRLLSGEEFKSEPEELYQKHIDSLSKLIRRKIPEKIQADQEQKSEEDELMHIIRNQGDIMSALFSKMHKDKKNAEFFGSYKDFEDDLNKLLDHVTARDYFGFHQAWLAWKATHGNDDLSIRFVILFEFLDEAILLYADTIRTCLPAQDWAMELETVSLPGYEDLLNVLEDERIRKNRETEIRWARERRESEEKERYEEADSPQRWSVRAPLRFMDISPVRDVQEISEHNLDVSDDDAEPDFEPASRKCGPGCVVM